MQFMMNTDYQITMQKLGSFLADFLNTDFDIFENFFELFIKYSLTFLDFKKIQKIFDKNTCSEVNFKEFLEKLLERNKKEYKKLQEQTDMILDYCLLNPNKKAMNFKPIERLYVLRRIAYNLTLLNENKASYYSVNLFSSYPGKSEKEIYDYELKEEPTQEEKNKVLEDVKKLDDVYERIKDLKLNDERLEQKIEKVSEYINREICTQLNNNIISHKEYLNYIESITEEKEEETL